MPNTPLRTHPEAPAGAIESGPPHSAPGGAICRCGSGAHADRPGFCLRGHPLPGHGGALSRRHGLYAALSGAIADERAEFLVASLTDDGGEIPTRRRSLHEYRARLHVHVVQLSDALERHGLFDRRGRLRVSWLQRFEALVGRAQAIDAVLGLSRRSRPVESARDIIREYEREQESAQ